MPNLLGTQSAGSPVAELAPDARDLKAVWAKLSRAVAAHDVHAAIDLYQTGERDALRLLADSESGRAEFEGSSRIGNLGVPLWAVGMGPEAFWIAIRPLARSSVSHAIKCFNGPAWPRMWTAYTRMANRFLGRLCPINERSAKINRCVMSFWVCRRAAPTVYVGSS